MIRRQLTDLLLKRMHTGKAIMLIGARQTGKTTLLRELIKGEDQVLWFNGDELETRTLFNNITIAQLRTYIGQNKIVVVDEAQRIENIGLKMKLITDNFPDIQLIITGSSSFELANKVNEPLTGRKWEYNLFPLSFAELAMHYGVFEAQKQLPVRLVFGCYPDVVCHAGDERAILSQLTNSYLYRDILEWERIKHPDKLVRLMQALAYQVGSEVSYNELSQLVQLDRSTIEKYINLLEQTQVLFRLPSFSRNLRNELKASRKIYFYDNGIRNALIGNYADMAMRQDAGQLWENYMISELRKKRHYGEAYCNTWFWRTTQQQEIDYLEESDGKLVAYEFKWNPAKKTRISKTFLNAYPNSSIETINRENFVHFLIR